MGNLAEFKCPKCGKVLIWANEKAKVLCNGCWKWIAFKDIKNPNPCKMSDDEKAEQLKIF